MTLIRKEKIRVFCSWYSIKFNFIGLRFFITNRYFVYKYMELAGNGLIPNR